MEFECWHTFFGKLMSILGVIFIMCLCYLIWGALHIRRYRRRMLLYRDFVRETYIQQNQTVPILITRYYVREVEAYNRVIKLWPFYQWLPSVDAARLLVGTPSNGEFKSEKIQEDKES